jgi:hypothetical protein
LRPLSLKLEEQVAFEATHLVPSHFGLSDGQAAHAGGVSVLSHLGLSTGQVTATQTAGVTEASHFGWSAGQASQALFAPVFGFVGGHDVTHAVPFHNVVVPEQA